MQVALIVTVNNNSLLLTTIIIVIVATIYRARFFPKHFKYVSSFNPQSHPEEGTITLDEETEA